MAVTGTAAARRCHTQNQGSFLSGVLQNLFLQSIDDSMIYSTVGSLGSHVLLTEQS